MKYLAILSIIAFFAAAGWVVMTSDGTAFRWFLLSALFMVFSVFAAFAWAVWREMRKQKKAQEKELDEAMAALDKTIEKLTKTNLN